MHDLQKLYLTNEQWKHPTCTGCANKLDHLFKGCNYCMWWQEKGITHIYKMFSSLHGVKLGFWVLLHLNILCTSLEKHCTTDIHVLQSLKWSILGPLHMSACNMWPARHVWNELAVKKLNAKKWYTWFCHVVFTAYHNMCHKSTMVGINQMKFCWELDQ